MKITFIKLFLFLVISTPVLSQNYFPLEVVFQWEYDKIIYNEKAKLFLSKPASTVMTKTVVGEGERYFVSSFDQSLKLEKTESAEELNKIIIKSYENGDTSKILTEVYQVDEENNIVYFDETYYYQYDPIYGMYEENSEYFDPDLPMDFSRPVGEILTFNGHVFSFNLNNLTGDQSTFHWYYEVKSEIENYETITVNNVVYPDCYKTKTLWQLTWGRKDLGPQNPEPEGEIFDTWTSYAWYSDNLGLVRRYSQGKGDIKIISSTSPLLEIDYQLPTGVRLDQNYPNPFNSSTIIGYNLKLPSKVSLIVYDLSGQEIIRLIDGENSAGYHQVIWDGKNSVGNNVSSGIYIFALKSPKYVETKKLLFLK